MLFLLLLFLLSTGTFVFLHSPGFYLSSLEVVGNHRLCEEEVLDLSGLLHGEHLLVAFDSAVREGILASPWVARASVRLAYPGRIIITIEERKPAALVTLPGGGFYLVDQRGFVLEEQAGPGGELVIITGMTQADTASRTQAASYRLTTALRVVRALREVALPLPVQEISTNQEGEVDLFLAGGARALLGQVGADLGHVLQVLRGVLEGLGDEARSVIYVDLRFEGPVVQKR